MAGKPAKARQNRQSIWLYNVGIHQGSSDFFSTRLEAFAVERAIAGDPDLTLLGRLAASQQPAVAGPRIPCRYPATLSSDNSSERANFFGVVANAMLFLSLLQGSPARRWQTLPGTCKEKAAGQRISALGDEWAYASCTVFTRSLHPPGPASLCGCERSGLIRWKRWWRDGWQPVIGSFRCGGAVRLVPRPRPLVFCAAQRIQHRHGCRYYLSNAVEELGLEWSSPEEPSLSRLDEWFLLRFHQAPRQWASPFFPEVHSEITKSWRKPYSPCLHASSSSALTSVDGAEEKVYDSLPPLDESSLPAHGHWLEGKSRPRQIHGQFSGVRAPCVVEPDGDEGCGWSKNKDVWSCSRGLRWTLHSRTEVIPGNATLLA